MTGLAMICPSHLLHSLDWGWKIGNGAIETAARIPTFLQSCVIDRLSLFWKRLSFHVKASNFKGTCSLPLTLLYDL